MQIKNTISLADQKEQLDLHAKKIMALDQIAGLLLKNVAPELFSSKEDIQIWNLSISKVPVHPGYTSQVKLLQEDNFIPSEGRIVFDLLFDVQTMNQNTININIEIQKTFHQKYPPSCREEFYIARQISSQAESVFSLAKQEYGKMHHVLGIWLYLNAPKKYGNTIIRCKRNREFMTGNGKQRTDLFPSMIVEVMVSDEKYDGDNALLHVLHIIFKDKCGVEEKIKRLAQFGIIDHNDVRKELRNMCNYSDLVYEDGIKKGKAEGKAEGRAEGKAEGRAEGKVEGVREHSLQMAEKMIKDAILPDKMIAEYSGLSLEEVRQLHKKLLN